MAVGAVPVQSAAIKTRMIVMQLIVAALAGVNLHSVSIISVHPFHEDLGMPTGRALSHGVIALSGEILSLLSFSFLLSPCALNLLLTGTFTLPSQLLVFGFLCPNGLLLLLLFRGLLFSDNGFPAPHRLKDTRGLSRTCGCGTFFSSLEK